MIVLHTILLQKGVGNLNEMTHFIYDLISGMCVTYYSQLLKCKSKPIVTLNIFAILGFLNVVKKVKGPNS